jgi:hypothetical protein
VEHVQYKLVYFDSFEQTLAHWGQRYTRIGARFADLLEHVQEEMGDLFEIENGSSMKVSIVQEARSTAPVIRIFDQGPDHNPHGPSGGCGWYTVFTALYLKSRNPAEIFSAHDQPFAYRMLARGVPLPSSEEAQAASEFFTGNASVGVLDTGFQGVMVIAMYRKNKSFILRNEHDPLIRAEFAFRSFFLEYSNIVAKWRPRGSGIPGVLTNYEKHYLVLTAAGAFQERASHMAKDSFPNFQDSPLWNLAALNRKYPQEIVSRVFPEEAVKRLDEFTSNWDRNLDKSRTVEEK